MIIAAVVVVLAAIYIWLRAQQDRDSRGIARERQEAPPDQADTPPQPERDADGDFPWYKWWKRPGWWKENIFTIPLGILLGHIIVAVATPDLYFEYIWSSWQFWALQAVIVIAAWMIPQGNVQYHPKLGKIIVVTALLAVVYVWGNKALDDAQKSAAASNNAQASSSTQNTPPPNNGGRIVITAPPVSQEPTGRIALPPRAVLSANKPFTIFQLDERGKEASYDGGPGMEGVHLPPSPYARFRSKSEEPVLITFIQ